MGDGSLKKRWTLWTVWSTELGQSIESPEVSLKDFTENLLQVIKDKDDTFNYDIKDSIYVIQPTQVLDKKLVADGSCKVLEIGGTIFKPGSRKGGGGWGQRWRLIAENGLVDLFLADDSFNWVKLKEEVFVVINGRVLESANRIWLDDPNYETKIIRLINADIKPGQDDRYMSVSYKFMNTWLCTGSTEHAVLRTMPYYWSVTNGLDSTAEVEELRLLEDHVEENTSRNTDKRRSVTPRKRKNVEEEIVTSPLKMNGHVRSHVDTEEHNRPDGSPPSKRRAEVSSSPKSSKRSRSPDVKTYEKLRDLNDEILSTPGFDHILTGRHVYGVVDEVIEVPTEEERQGLASKEEKAAIYLLRISDETMRNVLVRLCTIKTSKPRTTPPTKVGPEMRPGDIIRIHRATVQFENSPVPQPEREMVISSAPHLNYTIFNNSDDVDAEITPRRLAAGTKATKENDVAIIKALRQYTKVLRARAGSNEGDRSPNSYSRSEANRHSNSHQSDEDAFGGDHWDELDEDDVLCIRRNTSSAESSRVGSDSGRKLKVSRRKASGGEEMMEVHINEPDGGIASTSDVLCGSLEEKLNDGCQNGLVEMDEDEAREGTRENQDFVGHDENDKLVVDTRDQEALRQKENEGQDGSGEDDDQEDDELGKELAGETGDQDLMDHTENRDQEDVEGNEGSRNEVSKATVVDAEAKDLEDAEEDEGTKERAEGEEDRHREDQTCEETGNKTVEKQEENKENEAPDEDQSDSDSDSSSEEEVVETVPPVPTLPIKALTLHDCEQSTPVNLHGKIVDYMYHLKDQKLIVRVSDSTDPTVWLLNLIEYPNNPRETTQPYFDIEILNVIGKSSIPKRVVMAMATNKMIIFKNVSAVPQNPLGSGQGFRLQAAAETVFS